MNLAFRQDNTQSALDRGNRVVELTPTYDNFVFSVYHRLGVSAEQVLQSGLPDSERAYQNYFRHVLRHQYLADAHRAWQTIVERQYQSVPLCARYVDYLLAHDAYRESIDVWCRCQNLQATGYGQTTHLFNGGFEQTFTGAAYDWKVRRGDGAAASRVSDPRGTGFVLRIEFDGKKNVVFHHVEQSSFLAAGRYRLTLTAKTDRVTTDQGVYLAISDRRDHQRYARTDSLRGSSDWHKLSTEFTIPAGGASVRVSVCRDKSFRIDSKIRGIVWLDQLALDKR
jgi:hypothetical protein